jgi:hypothetical protein
VMVTMVTVLTMGVTTTAHVVLLETTIESHGVGSLKESLSPGLNQRTRERVGVHGVRVVLRLFGAQKGTERKKQRSKAQKSIKSQVTHTHIRTRTYTLSLHSYPITRV